ERAQSLLAEAGYPGGQGFPRVRLLINRNEQQRLVARSVAELWHHTLGIETEIILKNWDEYEAAIRAGDYDVVRRGMVMQTTDELTNMRLMFEQSAPSSGANAPDAVPSTEMNPTASSAVVKPEADATQVAEKRLPPQILSEAQALRELPAIPIYFASSYALVKPYVVGFDSNLLDAPSLKAVRIDTSWRMPKANNMIWK
ncbi:MAG TPA: ABC transporter substrate-binding protein, partial [Pyrinomonadaceae bacterium]|nr:ABC transporter substrate-binding protein [Pyrinomonadaceae bacterium]